MLLWFIYLFTEYFLDSPINPISLNKRFLFRIWQIFSRGLLLLLDCGRHSLTQKLKSILFGQTDAGKISAFSSNNQNKRVSVYRAILLTRTRKKKFERYNLYKRNLKHIEMCAAAVAAKTCLPDKRLSVIHNTNCPWSIITTIKKRNTKHSMGNKETNLCNVAGK